MNNAFNYERVKRRIMDNTFNYERRDEIGRIRTIDNKVVVKEPVGYCHYKKHKGYLLSKNCTEHRCLLKDCHYFEANNNHPMIIQFKSKKKKQKLKKRVLKQFKAGKITSKEKNTYIKLIENLSCDKLKHKLPYNIIKEEDIEDE